MKAVIEPSRLRNFFGQILLFKGDGLAKSCPILFTPNGIQVRAELASDVTILANYSDKYFLSYESGEEVFTVKESLIKDRLAYGFKGEKLTMETDKEHVRFYGAGNDDVKETLSTTDLVALPYPVFMDDEAGLMTRRRKRNPDGTIMLESDGKTPQTEPMAFNVRVLVPSDILNDLPSTGTIQIVFEKEKGQLMISLFDELGERHRTLKASKWSDVIPDPTDIQAKFDLGMIQRIIGQFEGEVWLSLNNIALYVSQKKKDYLLTYILGSKVEERA